MIHFEGKLAVITGAASGIGEALVDKAASLHMRIALVDINQQAVSAKAQQLSKTGTDCKAYPCDVSNDKAMQALASDIYSSMGDVDYLFNNAGIPSPLGYTWQQDPASLQQVIATNYLSVFYGCRFFIPHMMKRNDLQYIINTASSEGFLTHPMMASYTASKHAVVAFTDCLRQELSEAAKHIQISLICPNLVNTPIINQVSVADLSCEFSQRKVEFFKRALKRAPTSAHITDKTFEAIAAGKYLIEFD